MFNGQSRVAEKFVVRMPDGMREKIARTANINHRSMNSELVARLEESLLGDDANGSAIQAEFLSKEEKALVHAVRGLTKSQRKGLLILLGDA